jgi:hypothetical protein
MQFTVNTDKIIKTLKNNSQLVIIIVAIIFLYFLFYTDYIVPNNKPTTSTNIQKEKEQQQGQQQGQQQEQDKQVSQPLETQENTSVENTANHVKFDDTKNKEIYFENSNGRLNIDYNAPQVQEIQRISQCSYPMNSKDQLNMRDCTIDQSCLTKYSPQGWFAKQREAKYDLPGFNGDTTARFTFNENVENGMHNTNSMFENQNNTIYTENQSPSNPLNENFKNLNMYSTMSTAYFTDSNGYNYDQVTEPNVLYQNVPFMDNPNERGAMPFDLCRSCTVGECEGDICGSTINKYGNQLGNYLIA